MTYLAFHLVFIFPPLAVMAAMLVHRRHLMPRNAGRLLVAIAVIAVVYTTPWDNYLVYREVWGYGPDRVIGVIGYVPIEEYMFFVLQPLLTGAWLLLRLPAGVRGAPGWARWVGAAIHAAFGAIGIGLLRHEAGTYLGLILVWAMPVLALQWAYAGREIWSRRRAWALGVLVPTAYLWFADALAIGSGIWHISERYTLGPALGPLPLEEAVFFLVTNLLVVQGLMLFLYPPRRTNAPAGRVHG